MVEHIKIEYMNVILFLDATATSQNQHPKREQRYNKTSTTYVEI